MSGQGVVAYLIVVALAVLIILMVIRYTDVGNHLDDDWPRLDRASQKK